MLVFIFSRRTEKNSKLISVIDILLPNSYFCVQTDIEYFLLFFLDEKLEDIKAQKRKIVSSLLFYIHL